MEITSFKLHYTNCFLLHHGQGWLLIDTGYEWEWDAFLAGLASHGLKPENISHLLLTHHHDDHAGLLGKLVAANPGLVIVMSAKAAEFMPGGTHVARPGAGYITMRVAFLAGIKSYFDKSWTHTFPPYLPRPIDRIITGDTRLDALGLDLHGTILATPGHTDDSISLVMDDGTAYCGDAAANFSALPGRSIA